MASNTQAGWQKVGGAGVIVGGGPRLSSRCPGPTRKRTGAGGTTDIAELNGSKLHQSGSKLGPKGPTVGQNANTLTPLFNLVLVTSVDWVWGCVPMQSPAQTPSGTGDRFSTLLVSGYLACSWVGVLLRGGRCPKTPSVWACVVCYRRMPNARHDSDTPTIPRTITSLKPPAIPAQLISYSRSQLRSR